MMRLYDILDYMDPDTNVMIKTIDDIGLGNHYAMNWKKALEEVGCNAFTLNKISNNTNDYLVITLNEKSSCFTNQLDIQSNNAAINIFYTKGM